MEELYRRRKSGWEGAQGEEWYVTYESEEVGGR